MGSGSSKSKQAESSSLVLLAFPPQLRVQDGQTTGSCEFSSCSAPFATPAGGCQKNADCQAPAENACKAYLLTATWKGDTGREGMQEALVSLAQKQCDKEGDKTHCTTVNVAVVNRETGTSLQGVYQCSPRT